MRFPKPIRTGLCAAALPAGAAPTAAQPQQASKGEQVDEIVVTARRTGVPAWQVSSGTTTVVLVGAIET
jgi:outer membrane cobalamin receptor